MWANHNAFTALNTGFWIPGWNVYCNISLFILCCSCWECAIFWHCRNWKAVALKKQLSLPIVEVLDSSILMSIDALIGETIEDGNVFFPDTSGFCIDLTFAYEDEGEMKVYISPYANYYIYDVLFSETDKILFECYGRYSHTNAGCFFYNEILCIVRLYNVPIAPQAQCYYSETSDSVQLNVFRDKVTIYKESYDPQKRYTMPSCHERRAN